MGENHETRSSTEQDSSPRRFDIRQSLLLLAIMFGSLGCYLIVLWWRGPAAVIVTEIEWDRRLPFRPEWVWVYLLPYLIGPILFGLSSPETFRWYVRRGVPMVFVSLTIFAVVPTKTVRPEVDDLGEGRSADLYRNIIAIDGPAANAAPSLHVSLTCLLFWALIRDFPRWWPVSLTGILLIWLSTLLIRQHHLIDVCTGVLLASLFALPGKRRLAP